MGQQLRERSQPKPLVHVDTLGLEANTPISRLASLKVQSAVLSGAIERYWQARMGQAVSIAQIQAFHAWFYEKAAREGFMAYAKTEVVLTPAGEQLQVQVMQPKINVVRVLPLNGQPDAAHLKRIQARFADKFQPGVALDTLALDQLLDSASFDLPVELEATLRAVGPELLDLVITVAPAQAQPGRWLSGVAQLNNHGLLQYGRPQLMAASTLGMPGIKSQLSLLGQVSEGISYGRADAEFLLPAVGGRGQVFGSYSRSRSVLGGTASTQGQSAELGVGLTRIFGGARDVVLKGQMDVVTRQSESRLQATGAPISNTKDHQLRWRLSADNERLSNEPVRAEMGLTLGQYPDAVSLAVPAGTYARVDVALKSQTNINASGSLRLNARLRGQWANRNLDGYNQITLGGVNGVRAYTSADGTGDRGLLGTLELTQSLPADATLSVFYDIGQVVPQAQPLASTLVHRYSLQGSGLQVQGRYYQLQYALTWAKGHRGYKGWLPSNIESEPNNRRVNLSVSYAF
ncbi:MAG: ShlB/FhaC/HecB family hemolysin secretion/activation protein [Limnohabitans sp.]|nr:ShlB/FhaC/HecB family hemolysin secretion/activation protein [Limnohabitans sp.]